MLLEMTLALVASRVKLELGARVVECQARCMRPLQAGTEQGVSRKKYFSVSRQSPVACRVDSWRELALALVLVLVGCLLEIYYSTL